MLFPLRTVTRGRLRRTRWMFLLIVVFFAALYSLTAMRCAFPGVSANWIAWAVGLDVREVPVRPFLTFLGQEVAKIPCGSLALRLNLLAALVGALTVGWVYKIVWFVVFDWMREESAVTHASRMARFGGCIAAVTVAVSLPFWQAATRFSPEIFDIALILACAHLLTVYAYSHRFVWLLLFGVVTGIGAAESPVFITAAPFLAALAIVVEWKLVWCRMTRLVGVAAIAFLVFCTVHYETARFFALANALEPTHAQVLKIIVSVFRDQLDVIGRLLPKSLWLVVLFLGVGSAFLSFLSAVWTLNNRRSWSLFFLSLLLTVSAVLILLNVPISPWALVAPKGEIPATTYAFIGMGIGMLVASWRALAVLNDPVDVDLHEEAGDSESPEASEGEYSKTVFIAGRMVGLVAVPVLIVLIASFGIRNGYRLIADNGAFADRAADAVLDGLKGRSWVVTNGLLDPHLQIRAYERGLTVHLLCPHRARERFYVAKIMQTMSRDVLFSGSAKLRAESLISYNFHVFIDDLFATDTAIGSKAVCMNLPDLWYGSGWVPVPEQLFFGGVKTIETVKAETALAAQEKFLKQWSGFLKEGSGKPSQLSYRYRLALRRHMAFVANNLGVTLEDLGKTDEAFDIFLCAREFSPENISALLNVFELISRGKHPEMKDAITLELRRKVENPKDRYPLWALSRNYGYVRNYEMFVKKGWSWAMSSSPGSVLAGLRSAYSVQQDDDRRAALTAMMASVYEMHGDRVQSAAEYTKIIERDPKNTFAISGLVRLALQNNGVGDAKKVLETGEFAGVSRRLLRQDWAAVYLMSGDLARARVILQDLGDEPAASSMTLAMLAMVMIEQKDVAAVETSVIPRLLKSKEGKDSYFVQIVQGSVWQSKGKSGYRNARLYYQRAAAIRPDVQALQDVILMLDALLEDQKATEAHALMILRQRPNQPFANFVLGSIRLEQGQYGDAEGYLRRSTEAPEPTLAALNNYAQVLCRIRKLDAAEAVARKATARAPERYEAWSTLAFVLAMKGQPDDADVAMGRSKALNASDPRLLLVDGLIAVKRGNFAAAEKAATAVGRVSDLSAADRRELKNLEDEISLLRQKGP